MVNLEAWRKRRYAAAFKAKLNDVEGEAAETQVWIDLAQRCGYLASDQAALLDAAYDSILRTVVGMITHPNAWLLSYPK